MPELTTVAIAQPIHLGEIRERRLVQGRHPIQGTCFPIGGPYFLTAGHVVIGLRAEMEARSSTPAVGLFHPESFAQEGVPIVAVEDLGADLGIIEVRFLAEEQAAWIFPLHWSSQPLALGAPVRTPGFAYGDYQIDGEQTKYVVQRSFQGSIVADFMRYRPVGMGGDPFPVWELSFPVPRGHSGAPILSEDGRVVGIAIGNSKTRMLILDHEEKLTEKGEVLRIEQYESLTLGLAVKATEALARPSELLGATVGHFIASAGRAH